MLYQHLKTTRKIGKYVLLVVPLVLVLFFFLRSSTVSDFVTNATHNLGKPFWALKKNIMNNVTEDINTLKSKDELYRENEILRNELVQLQRETFMVDALLNDNAELQELLGHSTGNSGYISTSVIHDTMLYAYDVFIVDAGAESGVRDNMLVLTPEGLAIGYISNTFETTAVARRFSSPTTNIDVVLHASTTIHATLTGHGSGTMKLTVPRSVEVERGDTVLLPSFSTYPIGTIASIIVSPEDAYKTIYLTSPVNMYELRFVFIDTTHTWNGMETAEQVDLSIQPEQIETTEPPHSEEEPDEPSIEE